MNTLDIFNTPENASPFDSLRQVREDGTEFWSARDLMPVLGYGLKWQNFANAIDRAKATALNTGLDVDQHFTETSKKSDMGRPAQDYELTRMGAYLTAMNGEPSKPEIAAAQAYFTIRTRQAETTPAAAPALTGPALMAAALLEAAKTLETTQAQLTATTAELTTVKPKAESFDVFLGATGDYSVNEAAKVLSRDPHIATIGQVRLFKVLDDWGLIYREGPKRKPRAMQVHINNGRLTEKSRPPYLDQNTGEWVVTTPQVRITPKGLDYLRQRLATPPAVRPAA